MATSATKPRKRSNAEAANELADLILEHLKQFPVEEQEARIRRYAKSVDASVARAKLAKRPRTAGKTR